MKRIEIEYNEEDKKYYYFCPFCMEKAYVSGDESQFGCQHTVYAYETVNNQPIIISDSAIELARSILLVKPINFLETFENFWNDQLEESFLDEAGDDSCGKVNRVVKEAAIDHFLESLLSVNDLITLITASKHVTLLDKLVVAELDDPYMGGGTYYMLSEDGHL